MSHSRALPSPWISHKFTLVSILTENLRMTSAYCVSGLNEQLLKQFIYLPWVGSTNKLKTFVLSPSWDTMRMGGSGSHGACGWKTQIKPFWDICYCCYGVSSQCPADILLVHLVRWHQSSLVPQIPYFPSPYPETSKISHGYWHNSWQGETMCTTSGWGQS